MGGGRTGTPWQMIQGGKISLKYGGNFLLGNSCFQNHDVSRRAVKFHNVLFGLQHSFLWGSSHFLGVEFLLLLRTLPFHDQVS